MKIISPVIEAQTGQQADETKIMIAMKMRYENMVDLTTAYFKQIDLHLCAFAAVHQEGVFIRLDNLRGRMPAMSRNRRIISQYSYSNHLLFIFSKDSFYRF